MPYTLWWTKSWHFWPFFDGLILIKVKTGHPAEKTSFIFIYGGIALPSCTSWTANGDGRSLAVHTVVDKVSAKTGYPAQKTSFVFIYGSIALSSYISWTTNGDGRCLAVHTVVDKVLALLAVFLWTHFN